MPALWYDGRVTQIAEIAPNVRRFKVGMPDGERLEYQAGQFITMDLPIGEKRSQRWRSYSIAGAPESGGNADLELCIVHLENGMGSRYLFEDVNPGSVLRFKGPAGVFCLPENIESDIVLICTGTGVAPFRSMLHDIVRRGLGHRNIHLIFGTRYENGILYREEFENLACNMPGFRYDIALSREAEWPGYKGYVHQVYQEQYAEVRPDLQFYICGWTNMVDDAVENLILKMGYARTQIHFELYG